MNKDFPENRWLTAFVSFVILFNASACSASSQNTTHASTATAGAIATKVPATETPTPEDTATPTETPTPEVTPTETFAPMELSTDPEHPAKCTYEDVTSGRLAWNERQNAKPFPPDAKNEGWMNSEGGSTSDLILSRDSKFMEQLANICMTSGDFLGLPDKQVYIVGMQVLNIDGTTGYIHFLSNDQSEAKFVIDILTKSKNGTSIGIVRYHPFSIVEKYWNDPKYGPAARLYRTEGEDKVKLMVNTLQVKGEVPIEMEKMLFTPSDARKYNP